MAARSDEMSDREGSLPDLGTVIGVWAHPDDETYLTAGLMALTARRGDRVVCVTATRGEEGSWDEERWPTATMGQVREAELMRSLEILGVTEHHWLDYYDGTCASVDPEEGLGRIQQLMEEIRPDSVFTFGPEGMTGHTDHKAVCAWTTQAFESAAPPGSRLYYATVTPEWAEEFAPRMNQFNVFMEPGTPPITPQADLAIDFALPPDILDLKIAAIGAHVSQVEGMLNTFGDDFFREGYKAEVFVLGAERSRS
jgi:LmbE family N-acetylglucosaminyl deacetylase